MQAHTRSVAWDIKAWEAAVVDAVESQDQGTLAELWREGQRNLGDSLGDIWTRTISGLDSSAVTG